VNRSVDVLRFSGIVDPRRLEPGSIIDSKYVANVRVISRGLGEQAEAQAMGWLARLQHHHAVLTAQISSRRGRAPGLDDHCHGVGNRPDDSSKTIAHSACSASATCLFDFKLPLTPRTSKHGQ
jgi:hypothetical protein